MKKIPAKVYYEKSTNNILVTTTEYTCSNKSMGTKELDMITYLELKDKLLDEVDFIELEYGTLNNIKSYSINSITKTLDIVYYTQDEIDAKNKEIEDQQDLNARVSNISEYLNQDTSTITDVEDYILQKEQNKILNGGM